VDPLAGLLPEVPRVKLPLHGVGHRPAGARTRTGWRALLALLREPRLLMWALYIVLIPFYVVPSGLPQPGDMLVVLIFPLALLGWNGRMNRQSLRAFRALVWFTVWVVAVNLTWAVILWSWGRDLLPPAFYVYNTAIFFSVLLLHHRFGDSFLRLTLYSVFAITMFQVAASFVYRQDSFRGSLFFSNPNQLGYFALLAACVISLLQARLKFGRLNSGIGLTGCAYLALLSASRSALVGVALLLVLLLFSNPRMIVVGCLFAAGLVFAGDTFTQAFDTSQARFVERRESKHGFFEGRGYDRLWAHKEYLLLGAGEGNVDRFAETTAIGKMEIHSSAGTILFSYGLVGTILFIWFLWRVIRGAQYRAILMLVPPLLYTVAHQGMRFTLLWVLLALFAIVKTPEPKATP